MTRNDFEELFADAVLVHLNATTRYLEAVEAIEEARWALAEILADMAVCVDQLVDTDVAPTTPVAHICAVVEMLIGERRARTVKTHAERLRDGAASARMTASTAMGSATDGYCAALRGDEPEAPSLTDLQHTTDAASAAVADLDGDSDEIDEALALLDSLLIDRAQARVASTTRGPAPLVA